LLRKLAHAQPQLASYVVALPADQAATALLEWWNLNPGAPAVCQAVWALAPTLNLADAVGWHDRMRTVPGSASPLLALARNTLRPSTDRAVATRCLELDDPTFCDSDLSALIAAHDPPVRHAIERAAGELLADAGVATP